MTKLLCKSPELFVIALIWIGVQSCYLFTWDYQKETWRKNYNSNFINQFGCSYLIIVFPFLPSNANIQLCREKWENNGGKNDESHLKRTWNDKLSDSRFLIWTILFNLGGHWGNETRQCIIHFVFFSFYFMTLIHIIFDRWHSDATRMPFRGTPEEISNLFTRNGIMVMSREIEEKIRATANRIFIFNFSDLKQIKLLFQFMFCCCSRKSLIIP